MKAQIYCFHAFDESFYLIRNETENKFIRQKFRGVNETITFAKRNKFKGKFDEENVFDFEMEFLDSDFEKFDGLTENDLKVKLIEIEYEYCSRG